jgi:lipopolysaccharide export LptBFGC system permease protein LptF
MKNKFLIPLYLLKESITPILISVTILSILVFCQQISRNSELIFSSIINWKISIKILLSLLPPVFTFTLPVAIVLGEILAISRLVADSEWFALETSILAYSPRILPFLFYGVVGFLLLLTLNWNIGAQSIARIKTIRNNLNLDQAAAQIQPQVFISQFPNHLLRIRSVNLTSSTWEGVLLLKRDEESNKIQLLAAKLGSLTPLNQSPTAFEIKLSDGVYIDNLLSAANHVTSAFKENTIRVSTTLHETQADSAITPNTFSQASFTEMGALFHRLRITQDGLATSEIELEIFKRLANAFACIYAACTAIVLAACFRPKSSKTTLLILVSFLLMIVYYTSLAFVQNLAIKEKVSGKQGILIGCFIPSLILLTVYLLLSTKRLRTLRRVMQVLGLGTKTFSQRNLASEIKVTNFNIHPTSKFLTLPRVNLGHYLILSEFAKYLVLTIVILTITILLFTLLDIAPSMGKNNVQFNYVMGYLINLSPQIIYYVFPFSILIAVVAATSILSRTGQLTILLYNSSHPIWLMLPIFIATISFFSLILFASDSILPFTNREQDYRYKKIKGKSLEEASIALDYQWIVTKDNYVIGYHLLPGNGRTQLNALIFRLDNPNYYLSEAIYLETIGLGYNKTLAKATSNSANFRYQIGLDGLAKISPLDSSIPPELRIREAGYEKNYHEAGKLTFQQLRNYIDQVGRTGLSTTSLKLDLMQKLAFPFACITLLFVSIPICLLQIRRQYQSRSLAIVLSTTLALIFWAIISIFEAAGKRGTIPISLAVWSPHILFLTLAVTIQIKIYHS